MGKAPSRQIFHKFTLEFNGVNSDRVFFFEGLTDLEGTKSLIWPTPYLRPKRDDKSPRITRTFCAGYEPAIESLILIISTLGNIAAIASFIYTFLKDRAEKEKMNSVQNKVLINTDSKKIEITGDQSVADIVKILKATETLDSSKASEWIKKEADKLKKSMLETELKSLEDVYPKYQKLVELYENDKNLELWQKRDYIKYKTRMKSIASKIKKLKKKITQIENHILNSNTHQFFFVATERTSVALEGSCQISSNIALPLPLMSKTY